jgi:predicted phosphodiesterase
VTEAEIVVIGHSHVPFHKYIGDTHFINPGSVGRMFDGDPRGSCAVLHLTTAGISVEHLRIPYDIEATILALNQASLPRMYQEMFRYAKKTN